MKSDQFFPKFATCCVPVLLLSSDQSLEPHPGVFVFVFVFVIVLVFVFVFVFVLNWNPHDPDQSRCYVLLVGGSCTHGGRTRIKEAWS